LTGRGSKPLHLCSGQIGFEFGLFSYFVSLRGSEEDFLGGLPYGQHFREQKNQRMWGNASLAIFADSRE
jgi:hypothetical protein